MPANETIFEIHVRAKGRWRTLGTFEEAGQAIAEAIRLRRTLKYSGIRVTAESYQTHSGQFASRVVYRYSHKTRPPGSSNPWPVRGATATDDSAAQRPNEPEATIDPMVDEEFLQMIAVRLGFVLIAAIITLWVIHAG